LNNGPLEDNDSGYEALAQSPYTPVTGLWLDPARTQLLADGVFVHRGGLPNEWDHWPDIATLGIPNYYSWVYLALMQSATQNGDTEAISLYRTEAEVWSELGN